MTAASNTGAVPPSEPQRTEQFVRLLTEHQRALYVYILGLVANPTDADEVLQEANLVLWRKSVDFEPGTNFAAWAFRVAHFEVLAFRKRRGRERLSFEPDLLATLAEESAARADSFEARRRALAQCLSKLTDRDRDLLLRRYSTGNSAATIAGQVGRTVQATYQALHRIRTSLSLCMRRTLAAEERA
jgi:RNA polymerase sigma-70 factor (ECF subfamily)